MDNTERKAHPSTIERCKVNARGDARILAGLDPWPTGNPPRSGVEGTFGVNLYVLRRAGLDALCEELEALAKG